MTERKIGVERKMPHAIRCSDARWMKAQRRAESEGVTMTLMISELLDGYGRGLVKLPPAGLGPKEVGPREASRSIRATNQLWDLAKKKASVKSLAMNQVVNLIIEGYGNGSINLPRVVKSYTK